MRYGPMYSPEEKRIRIRREFEEEMAEVWKQRAIEDERCRCSRPVQRGTYLRRKLCLCGGWIT